MGETETPLIMHQLTCNGVLEGIRVCMLGFPNRMLYRDYKARYMVLGAELLAKAANDKEGVYALMDKIAFEREKFRCGHTMVFFRAGALAALEEERELMKVVQRNFRKYMVLRSWGWFIIIQKTRPLVGQLNPEQELANLEERVKEVFGAYQEALDVTKQLEGEGVNVKEEIGALTKQLEAEQGNLTVYQDRQAKAAGQKVKCEQELVQANNVLKNEIDARIAASEITKQMNGEVLVIKKEI